MLDKNSIPPEFNTLPPVPLTVIPEEPEAITKRRITAHDLQLGSICLGGLILGSIPQAAEIVQMVIPPQADASAIEYDAAHLGQDILTAPIHTSDGKTVSILHQDENKTSHDSKSSSNGGEVKPEFDFSDLAKDLSEDFIIAEDVIEGIGNSPVPLDPAKIPSKKLPFKITIETAKEEAKVHEPV